MYELLIDFTLFALFLLLFYWMEKSSFVFDMVQVHNFLICLSLGLRLNFGVATFDLPLPVVSGFVPHLKRLSRSMKLFFFFFKLLTVVLTV